MKLACRIRDRIIARCERSKPDLIVPLKSGMETRYLTRWWLVPKNPFFGVFVHHFTRSDDDRACHDHPWPSVSVGLKGDALEHTIDAGGIHRRRLIKPGTVRFRSARFAHRMELVELPISPEAKRLRDFVKLVGVNHRTEFWSLFITGPEFRLWGFHGRNGWIESHEWHRHGPNSVPSPISRFDLRELKRWWRHVRSK